MSRDLSHSAMARAWRKAAADLSVDFISPFTVKGHDGREFTCCGLLPHFGSPKGTVIVSRFDFSDEDEEDAAEEAIERGGYYSSGLNPYYYEKYDRSLFVSTLREWGWFGPKSQRPKWLDEPTGERG
ncbi:MAG: hypothetical protein AB1486_27905 [Planctomycetota bacterium]